MPLPTLVLIPGLGADRTCFEPQRKIRARMVVPDWIEPGSGESLAHYAQRMSSGVPREEPLFLGGASFGGMVALEMAHHVRPRAVFLISSCRSPAAIAWPLMLAGLAGLIPQFIIRLMPYWPAPKGALGRVPPCLVQWGPRAIKGWHPTPPPCPVLQIHGNQDRMMPVKRAQPDEIVEGAGHLMNLTHSEQVNAFLQRHLDSMSRVT